MTTGDRSLVHSRYSCLFHTEFQNGFLYFEPNFAMAKSGVATRVPPHAHALNRVHARREARRALRLHARGIVELRLLLRLRGKQATRGHPGKK